jgi:hypothetical protein
MDYTLTGGKKKKKKKKKRISPPKDKRTSPTRTNTLPPLAPPQPLSTSQSERLLPNTTVNQNTERKIDGLSILSV